MKKTTAIVLILVLTLTLFYACGENTVIIDWVDFIKWNDVSYENINSSVVPKNHVGDKLGEIKSNVPSEATVKGNDLPEPENLSASLLPVGTAFYEVIGYDSGKYITAQNPENGVYYLYKEHDSESIKFADDSTTHSLSELATEFPTAFDRETADNEIDPDSPSTTAKRESTTAAKPSNKNVKSEYIRIYGSYAEMKKNPTATVIRNEQELSDYTEQLKATMGIKGGDGENNDYTSAIKHYGNSYFENGVLIMTRIDESSGSTTHEVTGVEEKDGSLIVKLTSVYPGVGTCDVAMWVIITQYPKGEYRKATVSLTTISGTEESLTQKPDSVLSSITLKIDEIHNGYFNASHPWASPNKYTVKGTLDENYCVGDTVDVSYDESSYKEIGELSYKLSAAMISPSSFELDPNAVYKPVIYLYPEEKIDVSIKLDYDGELTHTYPVYEDGWQVTASPDGTLAGKDGMKYPYLFWEGVSGTQYDMSRGFCVKGENTEIFLDEKLGYMGLSNSEKADFMEFWLPKIENNPYNVIAFQTDAYTDSAVLSFSPQPDSVLRVFMAFRPSDEYVEIEPQRLTSFERKGFTVVEWGGAVQM